MTQHALAPVHRGGMTTALSTRRGARKGMTRQGFGTKRFTRTERLYTFLLIVLFLGLEVAVLGRLILIVW